MIKIKCDRFHQDLLIAKYSKQHQLVKTDDGLEINSSSPLRESMLRTELAANKFVSITEQLNEAVAENIYVFRSPIMFRSDDSRYIEDVIGDIADAVAGASIDQEINDPAEIEKARDDAADKAYKALLDKAERWTEDCYVNDYTWLLDEPECNELDDSDIRSLRKRLEPKSRSITPSKIASAIAADGNDSGLAEYVDGDIKGLVKLIRFRVKPEHEPMVLLTDVVCTQKLTDAQVSKLKQYLTGQFSDGWGEGLEQHPLEGTKVLAKVWWSDHDRKTQRVNAAPWKLTQEKV